MLVFIPISILFLFNFVVIVGTGPADGRPPGPLQDLGITGGAILHNSEMAPRILWRFRRVPTSKRHAGDLTKSEPWTWTEDLQMSPTGDVEDQGLFFTLGLLPNAKMNDNS